MPAEKPSGRGRQRARRSLKREFLGKVGPLPSTHRTVLTRALAPKMPQIVALARQAKWASVQEICNPIIVRIAVTHALSAVATKRKGQTIFETVTTATNRAVREHTDVRFTKQEEENLLPTFGGNLKAAKAFLKRFESNYGTLLLLANDIIVKSSTE